MTTNDPNLFNAALAAIQGALESGPRTAVKVEDFHRRVFREQLKRDAALREVVQPRYIERQSEAECYGDAEQYWLEQSSPSDATFR